MTPKTTITVPHEAKKLLRHNINNPLTIISLSLESLKNKSNQEIHRIKEQVIKIEETINQLHSQDQES